MTDVTRRQFIERSTALGIAAGGFLTAGADKASKAPAEGKPARRAPRRTKPLDREEIRHHLTGPIASVHTPFTKDGSIDFKSLARLIDFTIEAGSKTVLLTAGDSHFFCLSEREIADVTKAVCEQAAGRALVVAADRQYSTTRAVEFAEFSRDAGADVVMCLPPDWGASCTPETLAEHYAAVANKMPVMIVTGVFISRGADFGLKAIELAMDRSPNVVAVKDDMVGEFARRLSLLTFGRIAVFAGGTKEHHMNAWPYGCDGYMSTFITFAPQVAHDYWGAIQRKDMEAARRIIKEIDMPLFETIGKLTGGFDAGIHGILEIYGLAERWRRKPYYSLGDAEMDQLKQFLATLKIPRPGSA